MCGEHYDPGPRIHDCTPCRRDGFVDGCTEGSDTWPQSESYYWAHTRHSPRHQAWCRIASRSMAELLATLPGTLNDARVIQKRMKTPGLMPLRRLFR